MFEERHQHRLKRRESTEMSNLYLLLSLYTVQSLPHFLNLRLKRPSPLLLLLLFLLLSPMKPIFNFPPPFTTKHNPSSPDLIKQMINILQLKLIDMSAI